MIKNAYGLEQAAFDSACDNQEETVKYIQQYAEGMYNLIVSDKLAEKILECRKNAKEANGKNGQWQHNHWVFVRDCLEKLGFNAAETSHKTPDGLAVYDLDPLASELCAVAGPSGHDPQLIDYDELPNGFRWVTAEEWESFQTSNK